MPYKMHSAGRGRVRVTSPHGTKAKSTTRAKAKAQIRLLHAVKHSAWRPTKRR